jgi:hypothetical protein
MTSVETRFGTRCFKRTTSQPPSDGEEAGNLRSRRRRERGRRGRTNLTFESASGRRPPTRSAGRIGVNNPGRRIGQNPNPISVKFTGVAAYDTPTEFDRK